VTPRLLGKPYGRRILASLPPMRLVRELDEAVLFLKRIPKLRAHPRSAAELTEHALQLLAVGEILSQDAFGVVSQVRHSERVGRPGS